MVQYPDVFCVLDYPYKAVNLSCLKVMPDENNKEIAVWKSLDLTEVFFRLGEVSTLTNTIYNMLRGFLPTCPDLLLLSIVQAQVRWFSNALRSLPAVQVPMTTMRIHIIKQLVLQLLNGHTNAVPVLNHVWNAETNKTELRQYVLNALAGYYAQNSSDQNRLTRILEIAHELKPNVILSADLLTAMQLSLGTRGAVQSQRIRLRDRPGLSGVEKRLSEAGQVPQRQAQRIRGLQVRRRLLNIQWFRIISLSKCATSSNGGFPRRVRRTR